MAVADFSLVSAEPPFRSRKAADDRHIAHARIKSVRGWGSKIERMTCAHGERQEAMTTRDLHRFLFCENKTLNMQSSIVCVQCACAFHVNHVSHMKHPFVRPDGWVFCIYTRCVV